MMRRLIVAIIEFPFRAFDKLVSSFVYTQQPRVHETAQGREFRRKIGRLYRIIQEQANWILHLERKFKDAENRHRLEKQHMLESYSKTVRKLEMDLSFERMRKKDQH
jgi:hypothetical protein